MWRDRVRERDFQAKGRCVLCLQGEGHGYLAPCCCRKGLGKLRWSGKARLVADWEEGLNSRLRFELYPESSGKPPRDLGFVSD